MDATAATAISTAPELDTHFEQKLWRRQWASNSLATRLPASFVEALELKEGDEVKVHVVAERAFDSDA